MTSRGPLATAILLGGALAVAVPGARAASTGGADQAPRMARIPAGSYLPLYARGPADGTGAGNPPRSRVAVEAFHMDVFPVTNAEYLEFVRAHPEWRRSRVKAVFADGGYLRHWEGDLHPGSRAPDASPVVFVSWFAARAYLAAHGKRLPSVDEWEYAAAASETSRDASRDPAFLERLRYWYGQPTPERLPSVFASPRNIYGVAGLHGLVWEWTLDFNSALVTGESRGDSALERALFCGSGATGAADFENYASFMRYAFRSSLEARFTIASLGFRGVRRDQAGSS
ncbi:MAG TPA: formylglycine-generating enzyme family protein [Vicinamibacterales bacterium]|nr:formylglycine-generating enzyme family protein [Vicinamibacterales bacterium]